MDPFTAIGLASSIVQFVDYSTKLINGAREIYDSASGLTEENKSLESIVSEMKELSSKLLPSTGSPRSEDEKALCRLAAECNILSDQILELLGKIKPKGPKSKRLSTLAALRNKIHEREKLELQKRLESCRRQLELQLNFLTGSETKARLQVLVRSAEGDASKLEQLQSQMDQLRRGVTISSISPDTRALLQQLFNLSEDVCQVITQQRILRSLAFYDMHGRFDAVDKAHYKTFEWIFGDSQQAEEDAESSDYDEEGENDDNEPITDDEETSEEDDESQPTTDDDKSSREDNEDQRTSEDKVRHDHSAAESFIHWLSSGTGIFHVSGKLGSGKSTLMKYLCEHKRTRKELQIWAGTKKLVLTNFFFWKPGNSLQKSLGGLFRSLLYDILRECPKLIRTVFPHHWDQLQSIPWQAQTDVDLRNEEIRAAFSRLITNQNSYDQHCFCFFIDGLDEYEETRQEDYKTLVELLCSWTTSAPENVKLCVSSREYNVFLNAFATEKRLRLQDLTRGDMERYIHDKLKAVADNHLEHLAETITDKSNGIFLWVALVVKILRERLEDGYNPEDLDKELDSLPDELEDLFEYLLKSVDKSARKKAYAIFAMILELERYRLGFSSISCSFLDDYQKDTEFAMKTHFQYSGMSNVTRNSRTKGALKKVNGFCRGLIEEREIGDDIDTTSVFDFTHRSIPEFLERQDIKKNMDLYLKGFSAPDAICQLFLAEVRSGGLNSMPLRYMSFVVHVICHLRYRYQIDRAPYTFLEFLQPLVHKHAITKPARLPHITITPLAAIITIHGLRRKEDSFQTSPFEMPWLIESPEYVAWMLTNDSTAIDSDQKVANLLCRIEEGLSHLDFSRNFKLIRFLLQYGQIPQSLIHTDRGSKALPVEEDMTAWQHFILFTAFYKAESRQPLGFRKWLGQIIETFLSYGADPHLHVSIPKHLHDRIINETIGESEGEGFHVDMTFGRDQSKMAWHFKLGPHYVRRGNLKFIVRNGGEASLRDFFKLWSFENEKSLLELFDRKVQELEQAREIQNQQQLLGETTIQELKVLELESASQFQSESTSDQAKDTTEAIVGAGLDSSLTQGSRKLGSRREFMEWKSIIIFLIGICFAAVVLRFL